MTWATRCKEARPSQRPKEGGPPLGRSCSGRTLSRRRVEVNIESRDLAVARNDEIDPGIRGCFTFRSGAPRQTSRIVQSLGRAMRRIDKMGMRRSKVASELVQCVVTNKRDRRAPTKNLTNSPSPSSRLGRLFPPFSRISVFDLLGSNLLLRPVELGSIDPHAMQNDCELARDRDLALRSPLRLTSFTPQAFTGGPFRDPGQQNSGRFK
jgi:hypothetical protein